MAKGEKRMSVYVCACVSAPPLCIILATAGSTNTQAHTHKTEAMEDDASLISHCRSMQAGTACPHHGIDRYRHVLHPCQVRTAWKNEHLFVAYTSVVRSPFGPRSSFARTGVTERKELDT